MSRPTNTELVFAILATIVFALFVMAAMGEAALIEL